MGIKLKRNGNECMKVHTYTHMQAISTKLAPNRMGEFYLCGEVSAGKLKKQLLSQTIECKYCQY